MKRSTLAVSLLLAMTVCCVDMANAQPAKISDKPDKIRIADSLGLEQFKKDLSNVSAPQFSVDSGKGVEQINGKIRTLQAKYLLSPGDTLSLSVYGEPEFTQPQILIRPDGRATIEPFGEVDVAGITVEDLTVKLKDNFKTYLLDPKVSVKINNLQSAKVYIYGAVQKPGLYQQQATQTRDPNSATVNTTMPQLTVASIVSSAGGIKYNADLRHVRIVNKETNKNEEVDLMKLISEGDTTQDIYLRSGDSIYVPELRTGAQISDDDFKLISSSSIAPATFPVRVIGEVTRPGLQLLTPDSPSLNSAIAASQGYTMNANKKVVTVKRVTPNGNISTFVVDPNKNDLVLRPNDIVVVNDTAAARVGKAFGGYSTAVSPFAGVADAFNGWAEVFNPTRRWRQP